MHKWGIWMGLAVAGLMTTGLPAIAAQGPAPIMQPDWAQPVLPNSGMYYTPGHGGTGLTVDVRPNGNVFAVFYTYTPAGQPYYYLMQGTFQPAIDMRASNGHIGTMDATPYISEGGECVGDGCTYKSPQRTATNLAAHIDWITSQRATVTIGTQSWDMWISPPSDGADDPFIGTWQATLTMLATGGDAAGNLFAGQTMVNVARWSGTAAQFALGPDSDPASLPPPGARIYAVTCTIPARGYVNDPACTGPVIAGTTGAEPDQGGRVFIWYDPATGTARLIGGQLAFSGAVEIGQARYAVYNLELGTNAIRGVGDNRRFDLMRGGDGAKHWPDMDEMK